MSSTPAIYLTSQQFRAFMDDQLDGSGPCRVSEFLTWPEIAGTSVVPNARMLMQELANGSKLTEKGNLSRKLVELLVDRFQWVGIDSVEIRQFNKVINEHDYPPAMFLHAVLRAAGLARQTKGVLKLTKTGKAMLADHSAGRLQAALFRATFTKYNLAYLDGFAYPEGIFERQISLNLFLIQRFSSKWFPADAIMAATTIPHHFMTSPGIPDHSAAAFRVRVLQYLMWFGLMECTEAPSAGRWHQESLWRKSPLFDRMLSFEIRLPNT